MALAHVVFREEGEFSDYRRDLLAVALNEQDASAEVRKQAEAFAGQEKSHASHTTPIEVLGDAPDLTVRIGKMGCGPRDVRFFVEETSLVGSN